MQFYLAKGKEKSGPFTGYQVMEKLASGEYTPEDLGWHEELDRWLPLSEIPAVTTILEEAQVRKEAPAPAAPELATTPAEDAAALGCSQVRPFVRFFARFLDVFVFSSLAWILLGGQNLPEAPKVQEEVGPFLIEARRILFMEAVILFVWNFVDALLLSKYGTTLGKNLFRIEVRTSEGDLLSYRAALQRSFHIWMSGYALGIPLVRELIKILCFIRLMKEGITPWDRAQDLRVVHRPFNERRIAVAVFIFLAVAITVNLVTAPG